MKLHYQDILAVHLLHQYGPYVVISTQDSDITKDIEKLLNRLYKDKEEPKKEIYALEPIKDNFIKDSQNKKYFYILSKKINEKKMDNEMSLLLKNNGLKNKLDTEKFVPRRIESSSKKIIASYLRALLSCECFIKTHLSESDLYVKIDFQFESNLLAKRVSHLLLRFGIFSTITEKTEGEKKLYIVSIKDDKYVQKYIDEIGFINNKETSDTIIKNKKEKYEYENIIFSQIISVLGVGKKRTFDLQVSKEEHLQNFVCNDFVVHNSRERIFDFYYCSL